MKSNDKTCFHFEDLTQAEVTVYCAGELKQANKQKTDFEWLRDGWHS